MFQLTDLLAPSEPLSWYRQLPTGNFCFRYQKMTENEFWYGDCGYITGTKMVRMYINPMVPMGMVVLSPTVVLMSITKSPSPTKNRKREI